MKKTFRSLVIATLILTLSILLLPSVEATRRSLTPAATGSQAPNGKTASGQQFKMAALPLQDEEVFADLSVSKLVDSDQATPGTNLTYTITVKNEESFAVANVTLDDPLPEGLEFVSLTKPNSWTCTNPQAGEGGTINCTNPNLTANANDVFMLVVKVPSEVAPGTTYTNVATVSSTVPDSNEENNSAPATSTVASEDTDITVTKLADLEKVRAGENITYTITVKNTSSFEADNATLDDTLPTGTTFVSLTKPAAWLCTMPAVGAHGSVNCTNPSLAANSEDVLVLVVKVEETAQADASYTNTAVVGTSTPETTEENNSSSATTTIFNADLEVFKAETSDPVRAGTNLTYNITVQNNGPDVAANVSLDDTLPAGTTFVSLSAPNGWLCGTPAAGAGGTITCAIDSFSGSAGFTLVVNVDSSVSAGTVLTNTATATSKTPDPIPSNNSGTATTTVANLRGWTTTANSGVTEDESNPARPVYTNFTAAVSQGSPVGTYVLRYNIQAMSGLTQPGPNTRLRVRFRDEGAGSRVIVAIMRSPITGGVATLGTVFDSDDYTPGTGFQTQEILMPVLTFDFSQNIYWLEVTMTKSAATNQPGFGSAQINRQ